MKKTVLAEFNKFVNPIFGNFDKQAMALDQAAETVANAFSQFFNKLQGGKKSQSSDVQDKAEFNGDGDGSELDDDGTPRGMTGASTTRDQEHMSGGQT